jgi:hypothetical protein
MKPPSSIITRTISAVLPFTVIVLMLTHPAVAHAADWPPTISEVIKRLVADLDVKFEPSKSKDGRPATTGLRTYPDGQKTIFFIIGAQDEPLKEIAIAHMPYSPADFQRFAGAYAHGAKALMVDWKPDGPTAKSTYSALKQKHSAAQFMGSTVLLVEEFVERSETQTVKAEVTVNEARRFAQVVFSPVNQ